VKVSKLAELYAKRPALRPGAPLTEEQSRIARATFAIKAGVEALGPEWCCMVAAPQEPWRPVVHVRIGDRVGTWPLDVYGLGAANLKDLLLEIASRGGADVVAEYTALRAQWEAFLKWSPDQACALFPPRDLNPLPLPG